MNILTVDIDLLLAALRLRHAQTDKPPYIICNKFTTELLAEKTQNKLTRKLWTQENASGYISNLEGYKVLLDNSLKIGEVEIR